MTGDDLALVLRWRNDDAVRRNCYSHHVISDEEHEAWWYRVKDNPTKWYFIALLDDKPVGAINFTEITPEPHKTALYGFYSGDLSQRGIGSQMERLVLKYAFAEIGFEKLSCEVLAYNKPVIRLHRKHGFQVEGIFRNAHFFENARHDIYRLAISKSDWQDAMEQTWVGTEHIHKFSFSSRDILGFAETTGDTNPVHFGPNRIVHGMLTASIFSKILGTEFPGPGTVYLEQSIRFKAPVAPSQYLEAKVRAVSQIRRRLWLETTVTDVESGKEILEGEALVLLPKA